MTETFHIGDTVCFTATADNHANHLVGEEGVINGTTINDDDTAVEWLVNAPNCFVVVRDPADITLIDCPH